MQPKAIVPGLWQVPIQFVNAFLLDTGDSLTVIDTGISGSGRLILDAARAIGRDPADIRRIVVTHCHSDHAGSLAELKRLTGAPAIMHPTDAVLVRQGQSIRPLKPAPGLINALVCRFLVPKAPTTIEPADIEHEAADGEILPGGLKVIHAPGHCAGQITLLWPEHGGVLIAADAAANAFGLALSPLYENLDEGLRSLGRLATHDFEVACFGHGKPLLEGACQRFRRKWMT